MKKYLTKFNTTSQYKQFLGSPECEEVNVSYIEETEKVEYFDANVVKKPFTVTVTNGEGQSHDSYCLQVYVGNNIQPVDYWYSFDGENWYFGSNWQGMYAGNKVRNIPIGQSISVILDAAKDIENVDRVQIYITDENDSDISEDTFNIKFSGNIQSLFYGQKFYEHNEIFKLKDGRSVFNGENTHFMHAHDISELYLPTTGDLTKAYWDMFRGGWVKNVPHLKFNISKGQSRTFISMFTDCQYLEDASGLEFDFTKFVVTDYDNNDCVMFWEMFKGCTNLKVGPVMKFEPTTYFKNDGGMFYTMFMDCSSLEKCPIVGLENVYSEGSDGLFGCMFQNCSNMVDSDDHVLANMKFQILRSNETNDMFHGCSSLQVVPQFYVPGTWGNGGSWEGVSSLTQFTFKSPTWNTQDWYLPDQQSEPIDLYLADYVDYDINSRIDSSKFNIQGSPQQINGSFMGYYLWGLDMIGDTQYSKFRNVNEEDIDTSRISDIVVMIEGEVYGGWTEENGLYKSSQLFNGKPVYIKDRYIYIVDNTNMAELGGPSTLLSIGDSRNINLGYKN